MAHVHYKFSSKLDYNTVVFDNLNVTLIDLKRLIMTREKLRASDCDLQITNAQTKEEYTEDASSIPKGSSVIVRRVPSRARKSGSSVNNSKRSEAVRSPYGLYRSQVEAKKTTGISPIFLKMAAISSLDGTEDDKIKTVSNQCFYDSSTYKYGAPLPANYTCYRCGSSEHHIRDCPLALDNNTEPAVKIKKSTGIPRSFMVKVDDPSIKGAMLTNTGDFAVPALDAEVYAASKKKTPAQELPVQVPPDTSIPDELMCLICKDLLTDAVVIPCCGNSYCDDCIRTALLDSDDHVCPTCDQAEVSPDTLIANKFLRQAVNNFTNEVSTQNLKNTCSTPRSQDCTQRPSPAPTPPPQIQPEKMPVADMQSVSSTDSPTSSANTSPVVKTVDETAEEKEDPTKACSSPENPSVSVSEADGGDNLSRSIPLVTSVRKSVETESTTASISQSEPSHWNRSTSSSPSEGWTAINTVHPPSTSSFPSSHPLNIIPAPVQTYLIQQQPPLNTYPPVFIPSTPPWTSVPIPQGAPVPTFTSSSSTTSIPPLIPKEMMLQHRRKTERTPPRGSVYSPSYHRSKSHKCSRSTSRSPSQSHSHKRSRPYSPKSSHRATSSRSHPSSRKHSPTTTSTPRPYSMRRSESPTDHNKSRRRHDQRSTKTSTPSRGSGSSRRENSHSSREGTDWSLESYLRWKQDYKEWYDKYLSSFYSHFHHMPPPPLMPPPQPDWPPFSPYHSKARSPPSSDSVTSQSRSETSSSSYSDRHSTPTQSFSDSNSPLSDNCSSLEPPKVPRRRDENQSEVRESRKDHTRLKSPQRKSKGESKRKDKKAVNKEKDSKRREGKEDRSRQTGRSRTPDSRSDKKRKRSEETCINQSRNILKESSSSDPIPKVFEREKHKKSTWKAQPLTAENAWEGNVSVKTPQKININLNLDVRRNGSDVDEAKKAIKKVEGRTGSDEVVVGPIIPHEEMRDEKNDSWEIFPEDEAIGEDSDLWHCALTPVEDEEGIEEEEEESAGKALVQQNIPDSERSRELIGSTSTDRSSLAMAPSGAVIISEEPQNAAVIHLEKYMENRTLEKPRDHVKVGNPRREKRGSDKELQSKVSSNHREVKERTKRKSKQRSEKDSEGREREEHSHHRERKSSGRSHSKSSNASSQEFTSILVEDRSSKYRESGENRNRAGLPNKFIIEWKGNSDKFLSSPRDRETTSHSHSSERRQLPSKTAPEDCLGQNWTCISQCSTPPSAHSSLGIATSMRKKTEGMNNDRTEPRESRHEEHVSTDRSFYRSNEHDAKNEQKDEKKHKSHKKVKRHASSDEEKKPKKKTFAASH
ncbi:unnamed protein product [Knipowitschia caucasica]